MRFHGTARLHKITCNDCGTETNLPASIVENIDGEDKEGEDSSKRRYIWPAEKLEKVLSSHKRFVITSAQNNTELNAKFLKSLRTYCRQNDAFLFVIPVKYKTVMSEKAKDDVYYPTAIEDSLIENNFEFKGYDLKVLSGIKIQATAVNPLSGIDPLSKGNSIVLGHSQLQMRTLPRQDQKYPAILTTTGSLSEKFYSETKTGIKAEFNHSNSAIVIELDAESDAFYLRNLNFDGEGFHDLDYYYYSQYARKESIVALVTGDEHAMFSDPSVADATYYGEESITAILKPEYIIRHDVLDSWSVSHHHKKDVFTKFAKWQSGTNKIQDELDLTIEFIDATTPPGTKNIIVASNHNDHLMKWLNECNPDIEPWNAKIYHQLMFNMLEQTDMGESGATFPDPFELYALDKFQSDVKFVGRREPFKLFDIQLSYHGDVGANGSRGSRQQFANLPEKSVLGHSHQPGITGGAYQTGTSSYMNLSYNNGPSSWHHAHVIIHKDGKRQMVFIVNGKWRL